MNEWNGQQIEVLFTSESPKLAGTCLRVTDAGILLDTGNDGMALDYGIAESFIPFAAIRCVNRLEPRSSEEQEAKSRELNERFRRHMLETSSTPSAKSLEALEREDID